MNLKTFLFQSLNFLTVFLTVFSLKDAKRYGKCENGELTIAPAETKSYAGSMDENKVLSNSILITYCILKIMLV